MLTGIVPKMAIRFTSYEWYKQMLASDEGAVSGSGTFLGRCCSKDMIPFLLESLDRFPHVPNAMEPQKCDCKNI